ncbi:MAG TPA: long-chain fatty acid--CoA ligase [Candidatus Polarisedimenticolia bacterium]|jgi:long-chain acyl-CoA synthetase
MTVPGLFDRSIAAHPRDPAVSHWTPRFERKVSSEELARRVARVAAGLIALGLKKGDRVVLISENRPEWAIADHATLFAGGILVPVYTNLTVPQLNYILENSGARVAIASTQALLEKLMAAARGVRGLTQLIVIDESAAAEDVMHLESVAAMGDDLMARAPSAWREPASRLKPEDVATIIYTSGTTGPPKGVMLSHGNITSNVEALCTVLDFRATDTALSFLPLCHITQRIADYCYFRQGTRVVYVGLEDLSACLSLVRPTTFPGVPRVFEKARDSILTKVGARSAPARAIFRWALSIGVQMARCRIEEREPGGRLRARHALADRLALSRVRRGLGGRLRFVVCGGAPLNPGLMEFFLALGLPILEGYGLTETTILTINREEGPRPGTVGPPVPGVELRIEADGEILARGPGVGRGYYLDVKRTEEAFGGGWFRTGDLGRFDERGALIISGRKKELLITSGGKKISPALIEQDILANNLVSQVVLVGDGRKFVTALMVPDRTRLLAQCRELGLAQENHIPYEALLQKKEVRDLFGAIIEQSNLGLARFEQIKKFVLIPSEFTLDGGELTPTLKIKRRVVEEKYRDLIDSLYADAPKEA